MWTRGKDTDSPGKFAFAQRLYVIPCGNGYSCLGFDYAERRRIAVLQWLGDNPEPMRIGTERHYAAYQDAMARGAAHAAAIGQRCPAELSPPLSGWKGAESRSHCRAASARASMSASQQAGCPATLKSRLAAHAAVAPSICRKARPCDSSPETPRQPWRTTRRLDPMPKPANLLLAALRDRLQRETNPLERRELRRKIKDTAADLARAEYERKAAPVRRDMAGAY